MRGFVKGLLGCLAVGVLGLGVCYFSGMLRFAGGRDGQQERSEELAVVSGGWERVQKSGEAQAFLEKENGIGAGPGETGPEAGKTGLEGESETGETEACVPGLEEERDADTVSLLFAGDLLLTETLQQKYNRTGVLSAATENVLSQLLAADIFMVNQEFPFGVTGEPMEDKQYTFRVPPNYVSLVKELGIDVVTLANNHMLDFGRSPLTETLETLDQAGILWVGAGQNLEEASALKTISVKGKTVGFLGASRVIPVGSWNAGASQSGLFTTYDPTLLVQKIQESRESCDFLVVYVHWGVEYEPLPEEYQRELARAYIDAGADAVIGSHPHVLQGVEYYQGKPVLYSLGNFIFSNGNYETMLAELTFQGEDCQVRLIPCVSRQNQMDFLENTAEFYRQIEGISFGVTIDGQGLVTW